MFVIRYLLGLSTKRNNIKLSVCFRSGLFCIEGMKIYDCAACVLILGISIESVSIHIFNSQYTVKNIFQQVYKAVLRQVLCSLIMCCGACPRCQLEDLLL